ncbi:MAG: DM13 domain-containing protein [Chloroflexota bacterium]|nr:DM13 domain-containing protein [Chloroflexota bacterium]
MRKKNIIIIAAIVVLVPVAAFAWWLLSPLFLSTTVDEEFPFAATAEIPADMTMAEVEMVMETMAKMDQEPMVEPMPEMTVQPVALASGSFRDADSFHRGSGTATIYQVPDGGHVLRFEDFMVTNGPDLRVLLAEPGDPMSRDELQSGGYTHLAKLKGNIGNQNYEIPADIDLSEQNSVIIYCMPFHVIFSVAPLEKAG